MRTQVVPGAQTESSGIRWNWQSTGGMRRLVLVTRRKVHKEGLKAIPMEVILTWAAWFTTLRLDLLSLDKVCPKGLFRASNRLTPPKRCASCHCPQFVINCLWWSNPSWSRACDVRNELGLPLGPGLPTSCWGIPRLSSHSKAQANLSLD